MWCVCLFVLEQGYFSFIKAALFCISIGFPGEIIFLFRFLACFPALFQFFLSFLWIAFLILCLVIPVCICIFLSGFCFDYFLRGVFFVLSFVFWLRCFWFWWCPFCYLLLLHCLFFNSVFVVALCRVVLSFVVVLVWFLGHCVLVLSAIFEWCCVLAVVCLWS